MVSAMLNHSSIYKIPSEDKSSSEKDLDFVIVQKDDGNDNLQEVSENTQRCIMM
jgi:hypothetical protein